MPSWRVGSLVAAVLSLAVTLQQRPAPTLEILEPKEGAYISGDVLIEAETRPSGEPAERVLFFVDGRLVCTVEAPPFECEWNVGGDGRAHDFRVVAVFPGGRRVPRTVRTSGVDYVDTGGAERVLVTATVLDGDRPVQGLRQEAFRVYDDGKLQSIEQFFPENIPLELVVAIDNSDSMVGEIGRVREYVKRFLSALPPRARVTLVVFNQHFFVLAPPSSGDRAGPLTALDHLAPWGATSLHEAIVRSFDLLGKQQKRRGLVVFTDGDDTTSRISRDAVERRSETSDAVLYMIGQGQAVTSAGLKDLCRQLAARSGGRAFFPHVDGLGAAFDAILKEMSNQYLLSYPVPSTTRDANVHRIRVEVDGGYEVRARQGYRLVTR